MSHIGHHPTAIGGTSPSVAGREQVAVSDVHAVAELVLPIVAGNVAVKHSALAQVQHRLLLLTKLEHPGLANLETACHRVETRPSRGGKATSERPGNVAVAPLDWGVGLASTSG